MSSRLSRTSPPLKIGPTILLACLPIECLMFFIPAKTLLTIEGFFASCSFFLYASFNASFASKSALIVASCVYHFLLLSVFLINEKKPPETFPGWSICEKWPASGIPESSQFLPMSCLRKSPSSAVCLVSFRPYINLTGHWIFLSSDYMFNVYCNSSISQ